MTEFIIVFPVLFILIFGAFQFTLLYHAKITLNYATFLAARSGAVSNGHIGIMENALARGMAPLYTHCDEAEEVQRARKHVRAEIENGFAFIEIINPRMQDFDSPASAATGSSRTGNKSLTVNTGISLQDRVIPNDNLMFRPPTASPYESSIQDRNILKIRAHYCYPLYVPFIDRLLKKIMTKPANTDKTSADYCPECQGLFTGSGTFEYGCLDNGRFPINSQAIVRMQSRAMRSAMEPTISIGYSNRPAGPNTNFAVEPTVCTRPTIP